MKLAGSAARLNGKIT